MTTTTIMTMMMIKCCSYFGILVSASFWFCVTAQPSAVRSAGDQGEEFAPVNADDMQYTDARSYIMVEICLHRPLVHKRDAEELAKR